MLHSKTANLVKVGTVLVTLLASTYASTSQAISADVAVKAHLNNKASTLPIFVER